MKKNSIIIGILLTLLLNSVASNVSKAESTNVYNEDGNLSVIRCFAKGEIDFGIFLKSLIYNDGFVEGVLEPWNDVLVRNQCHSNDIYSLIKQEDKIRSAIRNAFLTCNNENVPQLRKAYSKLLMEIYYVRHVVKIISKKMLPAAAQTALLKEAAMVDRNVLYSDMRDSYVNGSFLNQEDFDQLFLHLENKYAERKNQYIDCEKSSWEGVGVKWQEFMKFFSEGAGLKEAGKGIAANAAGKGPSIWTELKTIKTVELFTTDESFADYMSSIVQVNVNDLAPKDALDEADKFIEKQLSGGGGGGGGGGLSQRDYLSTKKNANDTYKFEQDTAKLKAEFDGLYRLASDQSMELFLNSLDGRQVGIADDGLLEIINNSFSPLNDSLKLSKRILDRQCSGDE